MKTKQIAASGAVVFRKVDKEFEVALISKRAHWFSPKGLIEPGETIKGAALRETREETGLTGEIVNKIGKISYNFMREKLYSKTVHFYLLKYTEGSISNHDSEVDNVEWFPISEAIKALTYYNEKKILNNAETILKRKTQQPLV